MTRLMSNWVRPIVAAKKPVEAPMKVTKVERRRRVFEERRQARHEEDAGGHHGGGVDQRRDRGRAFHGVRQPGVQAELRRLAHGADEQQEGHDRRAVAKLCPKTTIEVAAIFAGGGEDHVVLDGCRRRGSGGDAEHEAEIADPVDDEGLDRGGAGRGLGVPEADQEIGGDADALPAEEQLDQVVGGHQHQHGEGEEREIAHEARDALSWAM